MASRPSSPATSDRDDSDIYDQDIDAQPALPTASNNASSAKRKRTDADDSISRDHLAASKRPKQEPQSPVLSRPPIAIPPELWQYIFTFVPPETLGQLLLVNRLFFAYLTDTSLVSRSAQPDAGITRVQDPSAIWQVAKRAFYPSWPEPLAGLSVLEFWNLVIGSRCQFCHTAARTADDSNGLWESGPGQDGVRVVWQFGIRSCGSCLRQRVQTESSLLFSEHSAILPVAPFSFITSQNHVVSFSALQSGKSVPPTLELSKCFYTPDIERIAASLEHARSQGGSAAKDAYDSTRQQKDERMASALQWESSDVLAKMRARLSSKESPLSASPQQTQHVAAAIILSTSGRPPSAVNMNMSGKYTPLHRHQHSVSRLGRSLNEANEGKAARRAEIERRCRELDPPISESLLPHMDSFIAAIQISNPLTDDAWDLLKPRLLSQRSTAEQRESERLLKEQVSAAGLEERKQQEAALREIKEEADRQWEESQEPVRTRLGQYADTIIRDYWADGEAIHYENIPKFAAQVLVDVRARYFSDLAREGSQPRSSSVEDPVTGHHQSGLSRMPRKLVLDNMRWVYDNKIKPLAEARKEMFLCNGCDTMRYYAFDGVVQHYAAKHTEAFSMGHIVVHWQNAEWPEVPPFSPDPDAKRAGSTSGGHNGNVVGGGQPGGLATAAANANPGVSAGGPPLHAPNASSTHFSRPFHVPQAGPFSGHHVVSPSPYGHPAFPPPPYLGHHPQAGPYQPPFVNLNMNMTPGMDRSQHSYSPTMSGRGSFQPPPYVPPGYIGPASPFDGRNPYFGPPSGTGLPTPGPSHSTWSTPSFAHSYPPPPIQVPTNLYQAHLDEVANIARETWGMVSNVRTLPQSVRMYVIIHHVVNCFQHRFSNEPSLDLFTDCLINHKLMRPLKDANGLACKTCVLRNEAHDDGSHSPSFPLSTGERKLYPFHSLLVHFKNVHIEHANGSSADAGGSQSRLDWKEDMIELPSEQFIASLSRAQGIDQSKMHLLMAAFPTVTWASEGPPMPRDPKDALGDFASSIHSPVNDGRKSAAPVRNGSALSFMRTSGNASRQSLRPAEGSGVDSSSGVVKEEGYSTGRRSDAGVEPASFEQPRVSQAPSRRHGRESGAGHRPPQSPPAEDQQGRMSPAPSTAGSRSSSRNARRKYSTSTTTRPSDPDRARDYGEGGAADEFLENMGHEIAQSRHPHPGRPPRSPPLGQAGQGGQHAHQQRASISDETLNALREQGFIVLEPGAHLDRPGGSSSNAALRQGTTRPQPSSRRRPYRGNAPDRNYRSSQPPLRRDDRDRYSVEAEYPPTRYRVIDEEPVEYIYIRRNEASRYLAAADDFHQNAHGHGHVHAGSVPPPAPPPPPAGRYLGSRFGPRADSARPGDYLEGDEYAHEGYESRASSHAPR